MKLSFAGLPFQLSEITDLVKKDIIRLIPIAAVLIAFALAVSFRSKRGVIIPLAGVLVALVWTVGLMSAFKISLSVVTNVIPVVLLSAGSAYAIHVLSNLNEIKKTGIKNSDETALSNVALPVILAAVTTMAGFISFIFGSYLTMIAEFGIFTALGILFSVIISLTFIPAILSYLKPQKSRVRRNIGKETVGQAFKIICEICAYTLGPVIIIVAAVAVIGLSEYQGQTGS